MIQTTYSQNNSHNGYLNAHFGMSLEQLQPILQQDNVKKIKQKVVDDVTIVNGRKDLNWIVVNLTYVIPKSNNKLALIIENFSGLVSAKPVINKLNKRFGEPLGKDTTEELFKQIKEQLPSDVIDITVWADKETGRFVRLLKFSNHLAVEYLDPKLLAGV
jgi:hypothetical protein